ncbi:MAG: glycosyltransferase [Bacteroidetes bacterium]|nr:glycosyltransferase [Bacteroidota bacterium]
MKKALIITYYWPPSGGAGVQRWLKFVKYLREFGWEPIVYTPENPEAPALDASLLSDIPKDLWVLKTPIREPYTAYKRFVGRKKNDHIKAGFLTEKKKSSLTEKIAVWIRGNFFIPDARKFWIKPSINFLVDWLHDNPTDVIISTGPPHSMHLIAKNAAQSTKIPWLADFRDPWTNIDFYKDLMLTKSSDRKHHEMEQQVLEKASRVVVVSHGMAKDFKTILNRDYDVITNGFDEEDLGKDNHLMDQTFSIAHIGSMVPARNPVILWQAIHELLKEEPSIATHLEIKLIGQVDYSVKETISKLDLDQYTKYIAYLPHDEVIALQHQAQVLLLVINNTPNAGMVVTGKIFEYINTGRPVLCIGPTDGDAASILGYTDTGLVYDYQDLTGLKVALRNYYIQYQKGTLKVEGKHLSEFTRRNLTGSLINVLNEMVD